VTRTGPVAGWRHHFAGDSNARPTTRFCSACQGRGSHEHHGRARPPSIRAAAHHPDPVCRHRDAHEPRGRDGRVAIRGSGAIRRHRSVRGGAGLPAALAHRVLLTFRRSFAIARLSHESCCAIGGRARARLRVRASPTLGNGGRGVCSGRRTRVERVGLVSPVSAANRMRDASREPRVGRRAW